MNYNAINVHIGYDLYELWFCRAFDLKYSLSSLFIGTFDLTSFLKSSIQGKINYDCG